MSTLVFAREFTRGTLTKSGCLNLMRCRESARWMPQTMSSIPSSLAASEDDWMLRAADCEKRGDLQGSIYALKQELLKDRRQPKIWKILGDRFADLGEARLSRLAYRMCLSMELDRSAEEYGLSEVMPDLFNWGYLYDAERVLGTTTESGKNPTQHIALIAAPKSASTFLFKALMELIECEPVSVLHRMDEHRILPQLNLAWAEIMARRSRPAIFREHLSPNLNTLTFLDIARIRPIILMRNLEDSVVSLAEEWVKQWKREEDDQYFRENGFSPQFCGDLPLPFIEKFMMADWGRRYDMVIHAALPWYCDFMAGWKFQCASRPGFGLLLDHESVAKDPAGAIRAILQHVQLDVPDHISDTIESVLVEPILANFNVGISGRGLQLLSVSQRERIARTWSSFSPEGL